MTDRLSYERLLDAQFAAVNACRENDCPVAVAYNTKTRFFDIVEDPEDLEDYLQKHIVRLFFPDDDDVVIG
jgi:hypothetical protein